MKANDTIRPATTNDFPALLTLQIECIRGLGDTYSSQEIQNWVSYIEREGPMRYASYHNRVSTGDAGVINGFVSWLENLSDHTASIECLYTSQQIRGRGVGKLLIRTAENHMQSPVTIYVRSTLNARTFYQHNGYEHTGDSVSRAGIGIALLEKRQNKKTFHKVMG